MKPLQSVPPGLSEDMNTESSDSAVSGSDLFSNIDAFFESDEIEREKTTQSVTESLPISTPSHSQESPSEIPVMPDVEVGDGFYF